ncbi:MAG: hypothetical protein LBC41_00740 [Clostridiales bacterium]|jgi:hypothetical protein|nr:hypothetical protein [Clostridiales bacterium]
MPVNPGLPSKFSSLKKACHYKVFYATILRVPKIFFWTVMSMDIVAEDVTREEQREILENNDLIYEVMKLSYHFFPNLFEELGEITDPRNPSYVKYTAKSLIITRIIMSILMKDSQFCG